MIETELAPYVAAIAMMGVSIGLLGVIGWIFTTWLRIKNGYPLENSWGKAIYPKTDQESVERIKLLSQENAQLRAEISAMKDRLANVERIVIDENHALTRDIEQLRGKSN
jgi:uncharacterized protein YlxW (UPF0749 family)